MTALEALLALGSRVPSHPRRPANTHVHLPPNFSAFPTCSVAVEQAAQEGLAVLGASNYYDYRVYEPFVKSALERGIYPLVGLEVVLMDEDLRARGERVNDPGNPGRIYLCGKACVGLFAPNERAQALLETIRTSDTQRIATMCASLDAVLAERGFDLELEPEEIARQVAQRAQVAEDAVALQERHLAQGLQEALFRAIPKPDRASRISELVEQQVSDDPVVVQTALRSAFMKAGKPAYVPEPFLSLDEGLELVTELGGFPCYPILADGASPICELEAEPRRLVEWLGELGIRAAEFIPGRNRQEILERYARTLREAGISLTAGTEHNTNSPASLVPTCLDGPIPDEIQEWFWEGAVEAVTRQQSALLGAGAPK